MGCSWADPPSRHSVSAPDRVSTEVILFGVSASVRNIGIRRLIRQGFGKRIIETISRQELVKASTYRDYERRIEEYARKRKRLKHSM